MKKLTRKKYTFISLLCCILLAFTTAFFVPVNTASGAQYYKFGEVTSIYANSQLVAIGDETGVAIFSPQGELVNKIAVQRAKKLRFENGKLYALSNDTIWAQDGSVYYQSTTPITDFCFFEGSLFIASNNSLRKLNSSLDGYERSYSYIEEISSITASENELFIAVADGGRTSVSTLSGTTVSTQIKIGDDLSVASGELYAISKSGSAVKISENGTTVLSGERFVTALSGDTLCYATDEGEIFIGDTLFLAHRSSENGFYNSPTSVESRMGKTVICDYLNDRVLVISNKTEIIHLPRPKSASISNSGEIFVAYNSNAIAKISDLGSVESVPYSLKGTIDSLYCDNYGALTVLTNGVSYSISEEKTLYDGVSVISARRSDDAIFAVSGTSVLLGSELIFSATDTIDALAVDEGGNFFYAVSGSVYRYDGETHHRLSDGYSNAVSLSLSRAENSFCSYGDLIVCDRENSLIKVLSASAVGSVTTSSTTLPTPTEYDSEKIIRSTNSDCSIYATPNETDIKLNVSKGAKLIVGKYDILPHFAFVLYEDLVTKTLIRGYVFKSNLDNPVEYEEPPAQEGEVYANGTNLYALPSTSAEILSENLPVTTRVSLLPFADYGKWYKVEYNGTIGYTLSSALSVRHFIPNTERPQCDAVIVEHNGSLIATLYEYENGEYKVIDGEFIAVGTEVDVVGAFDTSKKYTKIKYFDEKLGTLTCFVETEFIDYNSVSIVQIVALVIAIVTVILLGVITIKIVRKRNKI